MFIIYIHIYSHSLRVFEETYWGRIQNKIRILYLIFGYLYARAIDNTISSRDKLFGSLHYTYMSDMFGKFLGVRFKIGQKSRRNLYCTQLK